jgi:hypothetical protein
MTRGEGNATFSWDIDVMCYATTATVVGGTCVSTRAGARTVARAIGSSDCSRRIPRPTIQHVLNLEERHFNLAFTLRRWVLEIRNSCPHRSEFKSAIPIRGIGVSMTCGIGVSMTL